MARVCHSQQEVKAAVHEMGTIVEASGYPEIERMGFSFSLQKRGWRDAALEVHTQEREQIPQVNSHTYIYLGSRQLSKCPSGNQLGFGLLRGSLFLCFTRRKVYLEQLLSTCEWQDSEPCTHHGLSETGTFSKISIKLGLGFMGWHWLKKKLDLPAVCQLKIGPSGVASTEGSCCKTQPEITRCFECLWEGE